VEEEKIVTSHCESHRILKKTAVPIKGDKKKQRCTEATPGKKGFPFVTEQAQGARVGHLGQRATNVQVGRSRSDRLKGRQALPSNGQIGKCHRVAASGRMGPKRTNVPLTHLTKVILLIGV